MPESENKNNLKLEILFPIIVALITCFGAIISVIIAKIPVSTLPSFTATPIFIIVTETPVPVFTNLAPTLTITVTNTSVPLTAHKIETEVTGNSQKSYSIDLKDGEILVGHGEKFQKYNKVAFLIIGAGHFDFELKTGLWDKWTNVSPDLYDQLLKEQFDTLTSNGKSPIMVKCDLNGCK
jgi:hypothetical protein